MDEVGSLVGVGYEDDPKWLHARLLLRPATAAVIKSYNELDEDEGYDGFWVLTPTGDIFPEAVSCPPAHFRGQLDEAGNLVPGTFEGHRGRKLPLVFGFDAHGRVSL